MALLHSIDLAKIDFFLKFWLGATFCLVIWALHEEAGGFHRYDFSWRWKAETHEVFQGLSSKLEHFHFYLILLVKARPVGKSQLKEWRDIFCSFSWRKHKVSWQRAYIKRVLKNWDQKCDQPRVLFHWHSNIKYLICQKYTFILKMVI